MRGRSALAVRLEAEACEGSDPPLPVLLPHTQALYGKGEHADPFTACTGVCVAEGLFVPPCLLSRLNM